MADTSVVATKRYRYRIYPNPEQQVALSRAFGCARVVFNDFIAARELARAEGLPFPKTNDLSKQLITAAKRTPERDWLGEVSAVVLQQALADADRAYRNFFASITKSRNGRRVGHPRFRSRKDSTQSVRFTRNAAFKTRKVNHDRALLTLPRVPGEIRLALSRSLPSEPSSVTVIREADGRYYASFVVDTGQAVPLPESDRHVALDLGLDVFAAEVASDGTRRKEPNPRHFRQAQRRLAKAQQNLSRKEKGSANRAKARIKVAVAHRKIRETRKDSQHKYALALIRENQTITVEQLRVSGLARAGAKGSRGRGLRKSVHDASWGQFLRILTEKGAEHGRTIIGIDPAYTSQTCAVCGVIDGPKPLNVRVWACGCGAVLDRDYNAATNLLVAAGQAETINDCGGNLRLALASAVPVEAVTTLSPAA